MSNAIRGMVGGLDPHSAFMDKDEFEDLKIAPRATIPASASR